MHQARFASRRHFFSLAFAAGVALPAGFVLAQTPGPTSAPAETLQSPVLPVRSDVLRLTPVNDRFDRVVVTAIAADPEGRLVAVAGDDLAIRLIDTERFRVIKTIPPTGRHHHRDRIRTLTFDATGTRLASSGNDGRITIYRRADSFEPSQSIDGAPAISCIRFHPDGSQLAAVGFSKHIFLIGNTAKRQRLTCGCGDLRSIDYNEAGTWMAAAGRVGDLHLFDVRSGESLGDRRLHPGRIRAVICRPGSDQTVSVGEEGWLVVHDVEKQRTLQRTHVASTQLSCVEMLDSRLAAVGGSDNHVHVVNTDSGDVVGRFAGHLGTVSSLVRVGDWLFSGSFDATVRRWQIPVWDDEGLNVAQISDSTLTTGKPRQR